MDECTESLEDATIFMAWDANSGYWRVLVRKPAQYKTAYVCRSPSYLFQRMPVELTNALVTIQRAVNILMDRFK